MAQQRHYIRSINGVEIPIRIHTPRELLRDAGVHLHKDEEARRGREYHNSDGQRVSYRPVKRDEYDKAKAQYDAKLAEIDAEIAEIERNVSIVEARVIVPASYATFKAPPSGRKSGRRVILGVVATAAQLEERAIRAERETELKEQLIRNARIRELELRAQLINGGVYIG